MSTLQFSLFFAALLIGYLLIHVRLVRFESYLKEMAGLKVLNERLKGVSDSVERVRIERVEEQLGGLHDDLVGLHEQLVRMERSVHHDLAHAAAPGPPLAVPPPLAATQEVTAGARIQTIVESRLLQMGYRDLRLLADLADVRIEDRIDIRVEATKQKMPVKGTVTVRNGGIVDVALQTAAQSFP